MIRRRDSPPYDLYTVQLANGPLKQPRYINPKIEEELREFKLEIKQKFESSEMNKNFTFPRLIQDMDQLLDAPIHHSQPTQAVPPHKKRRSEQMQMLTQQ